MAALFGQLCRTCLAISEKLFSFEKKIINGSNSGILIRNLLDDVVKSRYSLDNDLPEQLCEDCLDELMRFTAFLEKCEKSESALKNMRDAAQSVKVNNKTKYRITSGAQDDVYVIEMEDDTNKSTRTEPQSEDVSLANPDEIVFSADMDGNIQEEISALPEVIEEMPSKEEEESLSAIQSDLMELETATEVDIEFDAPFIIPHPDQSQSDDDNDNQEDRKTSSIITPEEGVSIQVEEEHGQQCPECNISFIHPRSLQTHRKKYHSVTPVTKKSPKSEPVVTAMPPPSDSPVERKKKKESFKCEKCGSIFAHKKTLAVHEKKNQCKLNKSLSKPACCLCDREFVRSADLIKHLQSHTTSYPRTKVLACVMCATTDEQKVFSDLQELVSHMNEHKPQAKHICVECNRCFKMYSTLKDHMRTHSGERPFVCPICSRGFSQSTNLRQHLQRHNQIKNHKCQMDGCSAAFVSKGELESHMRTHTGDHPYVCDCGQRFTTSTSLVKHKRRHTGEKPYACELTECGKRFSNLVSLKKHILNHSGAKPFCCDTCPKNFANKEELKEHKDRAHKNLRFPCPDCGKSFKVASTMRAHRRTHTNDDKKVKAEIPNEEQDDEDMEKDDVESDEEEEPEKKVAKEEVRVSTRKSRLPKDDLQSFIIQLTEGDDDDVVLKSV